MSSLVLDLQPEVLKPDCDILNSLRKAHLIAAKLKLVEFDSWIMSELNGYKGDQLDFPQYRIVRGVLKARNPYNGWIPVQFADNKTETLFSSRKLPMPISEIIELNNNSSGAFHMQLPAEAINFIMEMSEMPMPMQTILSISTHYLKSIIEQVKNCLLEWTIKLEATGILGEGMRFSQEETNMAKEIPQQINNYYGTVVNGDVSQSQVVSGDHNAIAFNYGQASDLMKKVRDSIEREQLSDEDRESVMELISEAETKIAAQKKPGIIRATLSGLRDFLVAGGANVTAALVIQYLQTL